MLYDEDYTNIEPKGSLKSFSCDNAASTSQLEEQCRKSIYTCLRVQLFNDLGFCDKCFVFIPC